MPNLAKLREEHSELAVLVPTPIDGRAAEAAAA